MKRIKFDFWDRLYWFGMFFGPGVGDFIALVFIPRKQLDRLWEKWKAERDEEPPTK